MLEPSRAETDPTLYRKERSDEFGAMLLGAADQLEIASETVDRYEAHDPAAAIQGVRREIAEDGGDTAEHLEELDALLGNRFMDGFLTESEVEAGLPPCSKEDYDKACIEQADNQALVVDLILGYQAHMHQGLVVAYDEDSESVNEEAWLAAWKKIKDILSRSNGNSLATTAEYIDGLVKQRFGPKYKAMEDDRGPEVKSDTCARTFYLVMHDHLHRAIIGAARDEWTGYE